MEFFNNYTYRQKNYALVILIVLLIASFYKRALITTISLSNYSEELTTQVAEGKNSDFKIKNELEAISNLNLLLGNEGNSVEKVQQGFLNFYASNSKGLAVQEVSKVLVYKHPDFQINTHKIILKGGFLNTLNFIYKIEKKFELAKVLKCKFELKRLGHENKKYLYTTLLIQNYMK